MERENRYLVLKISDIEQHLKEEPKKELYTLSKAMNVARMAHGKAPLKCVVVEDDWPEYEIVWEMIEQRVDGLKTDLSNLLDCGIPEDLKAKILAAIHGH